MLRFLAFLSFAVRCRLCLVIQFNPTSVGLNCIWLQQVDSVNCLLCQLQIKPLAQFLYGGVLFAQYFVLLCAVINVSL